MKSAISSSLKSTASMRALICSKSHAPSARAVCMQKMVRSRLRRWSNGEPSADGNCAAYASTSTVAGVSREARNSGLSGMMILI